ncbi:MAG TPA: hypothetical protein VLA05_01395, partial [Coriobacteriia bacterium]|nr:hypothetical protein [Coriobacteriia bacterium]
TVTAGAWSATETLTIRPDPRVSTSLAEYEAQFRFAQEIGGRMRELREALARLRGVRARLEQIAARAATGGDVAATAQRLAGELSGSESQLTRVQGQTGPRLDAQLFGLYRAVVDGNLAPSPGIKERAGDLLPGVDRALAALDGVMKRADAWVAQQP